MSSTEKLDIRRYLKPAAAQGGGDSEKQSQSLDAAKSKATMGLIFRVEYRACPMYSCTLDSPVETARRADTVYQRANILNEYIKCVVVGDSGVGKTALITTWACDANHNLKELVKTHVSTVWAHDHYRKDLKILERSVVEVDGAQVSLRLWDTFGYHNKDLRFAYRGADVVLLCFNLAKVRSLLNLKKIWVDEIRHRLPTTPVVIVGCQADMRYIYRDEEYINMTKGLLYRTVNEHDIVTPEEGRAVAKEVGCPYYECSSLTKHGVEDVFVNVVRAAMAERWKIRFWSSHLRRIQCPQIQAPMKLPCLKLPIVEVPPVSVHDDFCRLPFDDLEGDVVFVVRGQRLHAQKICLVVAADVFRDIFLPDIKSQVTDADIVNGNTEASTMSESNSNCKTVTNNDVTSLLDNEEVPSACVDNDNTCINSSTPLNLEVSHLAFVSIEHGEKCDNDVLSGHAIQETIVTVNPNITPLAFKLVLEYLYTGTLAKHCDVSIELHTAARLLHLPDLALRIMNIQSNEAYLNIELDRIFRLEKQKKLVDLALVRELFADIQFQVDDGIVLAHKPLLMARCEVMAAMFNDNFLEASADVIRFPGINKETFLLLREFLYTGELTASPDSDFLGLIEVANRLCLPRLVRLVEATIVDLLTVADSEGEDILQEVLQLVESAQLHNATQLSAWCLQYLCTHYLPLCQRYMKMFKQLSPDNVRYIEKNRWPPEWYMKEMKYYEKMHVLATSPKKANIHQRHQFSRWQQCTRNAAGCLCFCRRSRAVMEDVQSPA